jgi:hypothetical protein
MAEAQSLFELVFPKLRNVICLTDEEAEFLYTAWKQMPKGASHFAMAPASNVKCVNALKTKGYLAGFGDQLEITPKGKKLIVEMVMHEPNDFDKNGQMPPYSNIKAKTASQRQRQTFVTKKASLYNPPVFNLHRRSLENMGK